MYAQLLKQILLSFEPTEHSKQEMIDFYREKYADNKYQLLEIDEFQEKYNSNEAIKWYTRQCFLYSLLNKALRTQDVDALYKMRFYIRHLHNNIEQEHLKWLNANSHAKTLTVYRESINNSDDTGITIINLGLTGDEDRELSILAVHLKVEIIGLTPLMSLARLLFSMGNYDKSEQYCLLILQGPAISENTKLLSSVYYTLGTIYQEKNQKEKAIEYYEKSPEHLLPTDPLLSTINNGLGSVSYTEGDYEKAKFCFEQAFQIDFKIPMLNRYSITN
ncbi:unnamed protein product [Rotaria sp. Silwood2]|nr:unnamed protein product [Rotaria sp. Silwood2]CAF2981631.1 unnamed protein product [Rotaria sp. Silwood2]CAF3197279.1 unnamed protein product [Rotaria sp. Silwood2]CAF3331858.1 unnamed protein product [Rotaria sp. Silwood2]CAF4485265.1 unnamed protein product [Rotaria sp. Silwood2]